MKFQTENGINPSSPAEHLMKACLIRSFKAQLRKGGKSLEGLNEKKETTKEATNALSIITNRLQFTDNQSLISTDAA